MKIDIVTFDDSENVMGIYIDGQLECHGDSYHDRMYEYTEGFVAGIKLVGKDVQVKEHILTQEAQEKFSCDGYDFPKKFPFRKWKLEKEE